MKPKAFRGYGDQKQWYWGMRSDVCVSATNSITSGTVYFTPFNMDTPMVMYPYNQRWKFNYRIIDITDSVNWTITLYVGLYKLLRGTAGTAGTLVCLPTIFSFLWAGTGNAGPTTVYDGSTSVSASAAHITPITDAAYYLAHLWVVAFESLGPTYAINAYGNNVSTGTWLYLTSGSTGQTSLPTSLATLGGSAKVFQEHWISQI